MLRCHRCKRQIHDKNPLKCQNYSGQREELRQLCSCKCLNYPWNCCLTPCNASHIPNYIHSSLLAQICRDSHRKKHEQPIEGTLSPCEEGRQRSFIDNLGVSMKAASRVWWWCTHNKTTIVSTRAYARPVTFPETLLHTSRDAPCRVLMASSLSWEDFSALK